VSLLTGRDAGASPIGRALGGGPESRNPRHRSKAGRHGREAQGTTTGAQTARPPHQEQGAEQNAGAGLPRLPVRLPRLPDPPV